MPMKNPPHPGRIIKNACLEPLGLTVTKAAEILGVNRVSLSKILNGRAAVSPEMALRVSKAFGSSPDCWLRVQMAYDVAQLEKKADSIQVHRYHATIGEEVRI